MNASLYSKAMARLQEKERERDLHGHTLQTAHACRRHSSCSTGIFTTCHATQCTLGSLACTPLLSFVSGDDLNKRRSHVQTTQTRQTYCNRKIPLPSDPRNLISHSRANVLRDMTTPRSSLLHRLLLVLLAMILLLSRIHGRPLGSQVESSESAVRSPRSLALLLGQGEPRQDVHASGGGDSSGRHAKRGSIQLRHIDSMSGIVMG